MAGSSQLLGHGLKALVRSTVIAAHVGQDDHGVVVSRQPVDDSQEVGVERVLIEDPVPQPVAAGDPLSPLVVGQGVQTEMREEG